MRKPGIRSPKRQQIDSEIGKNVTWKQTRKTWHFKPCCQEKFQNEVPKTTQINENPVPDHLETILLFPWCSKVLPRCQSGPQHAKMEASSTPNGNREELEGLAAEGVALKIKCLVVRDIMNQIITPHKSIRFRFCRYQLQRSSIQHGTNTLARVSMPGAEIA